MNVSYTYTLNAHARQNSANRYMFGFNGQEKDNEVSGVGNALSFEYRVQDTRLGRFLSSDPLAKSYPFYSPYQFAGNRPIFNKDLEGLEPDRCFDFEKGGFKRLSFKIRLAWKNLIGPNKIKSNPIRNRDSRQQEDGIQCLPPDTPTPPITPTTPYPDKTPITPKPITPPISPWPPPMQASHTQSLAEQVAPGTPVISNLDNNSVLDQPSFAAPTNMSITNTRTVTLSKQIVTSPRDGGDSTNLNHQSTSGPPPITSRQSERYYLNSNQLIVTEPVQASSR